MKKLKIAFLFFALLSVFSCKKKNNNDDLIQFTLTPTIQTLLNVAQFSCQDFVSDSGTASLSSSSFGTRSFIIDWKDTARTLDVVALTLVISSQQISGGKYIKVLGPEDLTALKYTGDLKFCSWCHIPEATKVTLNHGDTYQYSVVDTDGKPHTVIGHVCSPRFGGFNFVNKNFSTTIVATLILQGVATETSGDFNTENIYVTSSIKLKYQADPVP